MTVESFKKENNQNLRALERRQNELDQKLKDTERLSIQNEFCIGSLENKVNDLEQYTRKIPSESMVLKNLTVAMRTHTTKLVTI